MELVKTKQKRSDSKISKNDTKSSNHKSRG